MFYDDLLEMIRERKRSELAFDINRREVVIKNLIFLYHACVASEDLLLEAAFAAAKWPNERLRDYYLRHYDEEKGEIKVLWDDLGSGGIEHDMPDRFSMGMIGSQYYLLKHVDPASLLGYLAVMEADPTPIKNVEMLEELYGENLFRFLRMHAVKDLEHAKEIKEVIQEFKDDEYIIKFSASNALDYYSLAAHEWQMGNYYG